MNKFIAKSLLTGTVILCLASFAVLPAAAGVVNINTLQYPASPETLSVGERVPIVVSINYANLAQTTLSLHLAYADYPPRFQSGGEVTVSGSGTYLFSPAEIMVPASYSIPSGWPEYINEWHLKAEIWKGDQLVAGRSFTLLVENPEYKPDVEIDNIEYVVPPDTIAVGEGSLVKVHSVYSNLAAGTKIEATLRDQSGIIASRLSRSLSGSGEVTFDMTAKPKRAGAWLLESVLATVSGSMLAGDKKSFQINVVTSSLPDENQELLPTVNFSQIEYVFPPDTLSVGEEMPIKVHTKYSNLPAGTKLKSTVSDQTGILDTSVSRELSGSGDVTFIMTATPRMAGTWDLEIDVQNVSGSTTVGKKNPLRIIVVTD